MNDQIWNQFFNLGLYEDETKDWMGISECTRCNQVQTRRTAENSDLFVAARSGRSLPGPSSNSLPVTDIFAPAQWILQNPDGASPCP